MIIYHKLEVQLHAKEVAHKLSFLRLVSLLLTSLLGLLAFMRAFLAFMVCLLTLLAFLLLVPAENGICLASRHELGDSMLIIFAIGMITLIFILNSNFKITGNSIVNDNYNYPPIVSFGIFVSIITLFSLLGLLLSQYISGENLVFTYTMEFLPAIWWLIEAMHGMVLVAQKKCNQAKNQLVI